MRSRDKEEHSSKDCVLIDVVDATIRLLYQEHAAIGAVIERAEAGVIGKMGQAGRPNRRREEAAEAAVRPAAGQLVRCTNPVGSEQVQDPASPLASRVAVDPEPLRGLDLVAVLLKKNFPEPPKLRRKLGPRLG